MNHLELLRTAVRICILIASCFLFSSASQCSLISAPCQGLGWALGTQGTKVNLAWSSPLASGPIWWRVGKPVRTMVIHQVLE